MGPFKGTPDAIVAKLRESAKVAALSPDFAQAMKNVGQDVAYMDQPEFARFWAEDAKLVRDAVATIGKV